MQVCVCSIVHDAIFSDFVPLGGKSFVLHSIQDVSCFCGGLSLSPSWPCSVPSCCFFIFALLFLSIFLFSRSCPSSGCLRSLECASSFWWVERKYNDRVEHSGRNACRNQSSLPSRSTPPLQDTPACTHTPTHFFVLYLTLHALLAASSHLL